MVQIWASAQIRCSFRKIRHRVEELSEVEFKLKGFRFTLTTMTVDGDLLPCIISSIEAYGGNNGKLLPANAARSCRKTA